MVRPELWARNRSDLSMEGHGSGTIALQYRFLWKKLDLGMRVKYLSPHSFQGMAGINLPFLALGHLKESGLLKEVRQPGPEALARGGERTRLWADTLSNSSSSWGIAFFPWSDILGIVYGQREKDHYLTFWIRPLAGENLEMELLLMGSYGKGSTPESLWYPPETGQAGGYRGLSALRSTLNFPGVMLSGTLMLSLGETLRPGLMASLSFNASDRKGPWMFQSRLTARSPYFRNADAAIPPALYGLALDLTRRPSQGFLLGLDYLAQIELSVIEEKIFNDKGALRLGWKGKVWSIEGSSYFRNLISESPESPHRYRITGNLEGEKLDGRLSFAWDREQGFTLGLKGDLILGESFSGYGEGLVRFWQSKLIFAFEMGVKLNFSQSLLRLDFEIGEFDFQSAPINLGDLHIAIRWVYYF